LPAKFLITNTHMSKVLFILKRREDFNSATHSALGMSTGLFNSASFMNDMLTSQGVESKMVVVIDNNDIDREVHSYRPTHVIIEALWVVPTKFEILQKLHPTVKWIVRLHSEMPFMAGEGSAMNWLGDYCSYKNVIIGVNAPRMMNEVKFYLQHKYNWADEIANERVIYMPNFYPQLGYKMKNINKDDEFVNIGCFGAVRPLKNHLVQAFAALKFAKKIGKKLRFHINAGRIEMKGDSVVHNLTGLFMHLADQGHELVNNPWAPRMEFLQLCRTMDIGMQCNFSETFNIVGCDLLTQGVPIVGSKEIPWIDSGACADPTSSDDIAALLFEVYNNPSDNVNKNQVLLTAYTDESARIWTDYFKG
jgi:hypothetical protein